MANPDHVRMLKQGADAWNDAVYHRRVERGDLTDTNLALCQLAGMNLASVDLTGAVLRGADLRETTFNCDSKLVKADLEGADLRGALIMGADLSYANLRGADLRAAAVDGDLTEADLRGADARGTDFRGAKFDRTDIRDILFSRETRWPTNYSPTGKQQDDPQDADPLNHDFSVAFSAELTPEQVRATLEALADYYRACGGAGFQIDFELESVVIEPRHV